jgi:hypothetical protein
MQIKKYLILTCLVYLLLATGYTTSGSSHTNSTRGDTALISRGIIKNLSNYEIVDVEVLHLPTRVIAGVSSILPGLTAEMGIRPRELKAKSAVLTWHEKDRRYQVALTMPKTPAENVSKRYIVIYQISQGGKASVRLVSDTHKQ